MYLLRFISISFYIKKRKHWRLLLAYISNVIERNNSCMFGETSKSYVVRHNGRLCKVWKKVILQKFIFTSNQSQLFKIIQWIWKLFVWCWNRSGGSSYVPDIGEITVKHLLNLNTLHGINYIQTWYDLNDAINLEESNNPLFLKL